MYTHICVYIYIYTYIYIYITSVDRLRARLLGAVLAEDNN